MRALTLAAAATLALTLAGCGGDGGSTDTTTGTETDTGTTTPPPGNDPPQASLTASAEQGAIPFNVTFELGGTDPDGDALSWTLDADGDGTADGQGEELPATFAFTYEAAGSYNVTYTVSDGELDDTINITIEATSSGTAVVHTISGSWTTGMPVYCAGQYPNPYHVANSSSHEVAMYIADVPPETIGLSFRATFGAKGAGEQSAHLHFSSENSIVLEAFSNSDDPAFIEGVIPEESTKVTFGICGPQGNEVVFEVLA